MFWGVNIQADHLNMFVFFTQVIVNLILLEVAFGYTDVKIFTLFANLKNNLKNGF